MPSVFPILDTDMVGVNFGEMRLVCTHWLNRNDVKPLVWLPVEPEDFSFRVRVWGYDPEVMMQRMSGKSIANGHFWLI